MISVSCTVKDSKMFARSTPNTCGPRLELAHFRSPKMLNRTAKKMGATPILLYRDHIRAAKQNTMPSDFVILAIFRDKRNQCALYIAIWRPFTRQIEGIHHAFVGLSRG